MEHMKGEWMNNFDVNVVQMTIDVISFAQQNDGHLRRRKRNSQFFKAFSFSFPFSTFCRNFSFRFVSEKLSSFVSLSHKHYLIQLTS